MKKSAETFADLVAQHFPTGACKLVPLPVSRHRGHVVSQIHPDDTVLIAIAATSKGDTIRNAMRVLRRAGVKSVDIIVMLNRLNWETEREIQEELYDGGGTLLSIYELRLPVLIEGLDGCERCCLRNRILQLAADARVPSTLRTYVRMLRGQMTMGRRRIRPFQGSLVDFSTIDRVAGISPKLIQVITEQAYWAAQAGGRHLEINEFDDCAQDIADRRSPILSNIVRGLPREALSDPRVTDRLMKYLTEKVTPDGISRWEELGRALAEYGFTNWCGWFFEWLQSLNDSLAPEPIAQCSATRRKELEARHKRVWGFVAFAVFAFLSSDNVQEGSSLEEERRIEVLACIQRAKGKCPENGDQLEAVYDEISRYLSDENYGVTDGLEDGTEDSNDIL
jgi:hypothetical protein